MKDCEKLNRLPKDVQNEVIETLSVNTPMKFGANAICRSIK